MNRQKNNLIGGKGMERLTEKRPIELDYGYRTKEFVCTEEVVQKLGELETIIDQGYVTEAPATHLRITYMRPTKRDYSDKYHPDCYKYTCPVCDMLGNKHQVHKGEANCCLCGVNLLWEEEIKQ